MPLLTMRHEYEYIVFFWKGLHGMYAFVKFASDITFIPCSSDDYGLLMVPPLCRTDRFQRSFFNP